jgi:hypothetical protein
MAMIAFSQYLNKARESRCYYKIPGLGNLSSKNMLTGFLFLSSKSRQVSLDSFFQSQISDRKSEKGSKTGPVVGFPAEQDLPVLSKKPVRDSVFCLLILFCLPV